MSTSRQKAAAIEVFALRSKLLGCANELEYDLSAVPREGEFSMSFVDMLSYFGRATPEKPAIILADRIVTFNMLAAGIGSVCASIRAAGIDQSQTIGVHVESPTKHLIVVSALYRLGIVSVSLSGREDPEAAGFRLDATITDQPTVPPRFGRVVKLEDSWLMRGTDPHEKVSGFTRDDQLARIVMSSGTTATPKAIGQTAKVMEDRISTLRRLLTLAPWDRMLCLPALTTAYGGLSTITALAHGHTLVIADNAVDALQMIMLYAVDMLVCSPRHLVAMLEQHRANPVPLSSLRLIEYGGDVAAPELVSEARLRFCKDLFCVYSSTETGSMAFGHIDKLRECPGSTGLVAPWVNVEIVDANERPVPANVEGRLRVRSRWQGYDLREGPAAANKWVYPGDIARLTDDGQLCLVGRTADAVRIGDRLVSPEQIEQALYGFAGVDDVAAVGMEQTNGEKQIWLAVISSAGFDQAKLDAFLVEKNPAWRVPTIKLVDEIPRNDMGKIVRGRLKEILRCA